MQWPNSPRRQSIYFSIDVCNYDYEGVFSKGKERAKRDRENLVKECGQRILHDDLASSNTKTVTINLSGLIHIACHTTRTA